MGLPRILPVGRPQDAPRTPAQRYRHLAESATRLLAGMLANPSLMTPKMLECLEFREELVEVALHTACYLDRLTQAECTPEDAPDD